MRPLHEGLEYKDFTWPYYIGGDTGIFGVKEEEDEEKDAEIETPDDTTEPGDNGGNSGGNNGGSSGGDNSGSGGGDNSGSGAEIIIVGGN